MEFGRSSPCIVTRAREGRPSTHYPPRGRVKVIEFLTPVRNPITPGSRIINSISGLEL